MYEYLFNNTSEIFIKYCNLVSYILLNLLNPSATFNNNIYDLVFEKFAKCLLYNNLNGGL